MRRLALAALCTTLAAAATACSLVRDDDTYRLVAYFDRAVSVFPSSDVRVLGLPAGTVSEVEIEGDRVRVEMSIPSDIKVPADATAQIVPQSLIGERYIRIAPAYVDGMEAAEDGDVIADTLIPVEPDEALAALKEFLDSLDPDGLGTLVSNLEEDLRGNGQGLNDALGSLSQLVETFAENDDVLLRIVDSFDRLTATLSTRERQLGEVMDAFAEASQVLADERQGIEDLVSGLAELSENGLALVGEHATALRSDIATLADAAATIDANLAAVTQLLAAGPHLVEGLIDGYNPELRAMNLRNNFTALVPEILCAALPFLAEVPILGIPLLGEVFSCDQDVEGAATGAPTPAQLDQPSPVGAVLDLLGTPTAPPPPPAPGVLERAGDIAGSAAGALLGVRR